MATRTERKRAVVDNHLDITIIVTTEEAEEGQPENDNKIAVLYTVVTGAINAPAAERTLLSIVSGHVQSKEGSSDSGRPVYIETDLSWADFQERAAGRLSEVH
ncbi:MAG: hypothetical protein WC675_00525 [Patescibacteria group bacterium]|jgi:hypothetical protein